MSSNIAIIAGAGARKTQQIVEEALALRDERVLITTFTLENQREIVGRIEQIAGLVPPNVTVLGWFSFLIQHGARPYQPALTREAGIIRGLNFHGRRGRYTKKSDVGRYFLDSSHNLYRDEVASFVCEVNKQTSGAVVARLEHIFGHIFVDEVQDLAAYDLDLLELLFKSEINTTVVGDPRQHTYRTGLGQKNKQYLGHNLPRWFKERDAVCPIEERTENYRCNQTICDFADALFPAYAESKSMMTDETGHDGVFTIRQSEVPAYYETYRPTVLRHDKRTNTLGLSATNIGVAKGKSFDRVLIFTTDPMRKYLEGRDPGRLKAPERLYVAVTRARYSVTFVVP